MRTELGGSIHIFFCQQEPLSEERMGKNSLAAVTCGILLAVIICSSFALQCGATITAVDLVVPLAIDSALDIIKREDHEKLYLPGKLVQVNNVAGHCITVTIRYMNYVSTQKKLKTLLVTLEDLDKKIQAGYKFINGQRASITGNFKKSEKLTGEPNGWVSISVTTVENLATLEKEWKLFPFS